MAIGKAIVSDRGGRPMVKTSMLMGKAAGKAVASVGNRFALAGVSPAGGAVVISFVKVRARRMAVGPRVGVIVASAARIVRRILMITCNATGGSTFAKSTGVVRARRVAGHPIAGIVRDLSKRITNLRVAVAGKRPKRAPDVLVHNVDSVDTGASPLVMLSNVPCRKK